MNEGLAETLEWQARCRDLETANEQLREEREILREERDGAMEHWRINKEKNEQLWERIHALEAALHEANAKNDRLRIHLQQGIEL